MSDTLFEHSVFPNTRAHSNKPAFGWRHLSTTLLSLSLLATALLVMWLSQALRSAAPEQLTIREIALASPPPPPPPPAQQQQVESPLTLQVDGNGAVLPNIEVTPSISIDRPELPTVKTSQQQWQPLEINWEAFDLSQLDGLPSLLTALRVNFPKSLSRRGINRVLIKLDVLIDESGRATLINIVSNPYPELEGEIRNLVKNSRFTAPTREAQAVRARFVWPVEIEA